ncbi:hypothetical protein GCM10009101_24040 [Brevundimonas lenta]
MTAAGLALGLALTGAPAQAQTFIPSVIGATVGNITANSGNGCGAGPEAMVDWKASSSPLIDGVLNTYAGAMATGDRRKARSVFKSRQWIDASGAVQNPFELSPFSIPGQEGTPVLRQTELIMGGDYQSAQGRWAFGPDGASTRYATVDLERDFFGAWKIKRLEVAEVAPEPLPDRFCSYRDLVARTAG